MNHRSSNVYDTSTETLFSTQRLSSDAENPGWISRLEKVLRHVNITKGSFDCKATGDMEGRTFHAAHFGFQLHCSILSLLYHKMSPLRPTSGGSTRVLFT